MTQTLSCVICNLPWMHYNEERFMTAGPREVPQSLHVQDIGYLVVIVLMHMAKQVTGALPMQARLISPAAV